MDHRQLLIDFLNEILKDMPMFEDQDCNNDDLQDVIYTTVQDLAENCLIQNLTAEMILEKWTIKPVVLSERGKAISLEEFDRVFMDSLNNVFKDFLDDDQSEEQESIIVDVLDPFLEAFNILHLPMQITKKRQKIHGDYWWIFRVGK